MVVKAAVGEKEQMGSLLLFIDKTTYLVSRCTVYENLYLSEPDDVPSTTNLSSALQQLYTAMLRFLVKAIRLLDGGTAKRSLNAFLRPDEIVKFDGDCQTLQERVFIEAENCESCCNSTMRKDVAHLRNVLEEISKAAAAIYHTNRTVEALWRQATLDERTQILNWTSNIPYEDHHYNARKGRTEGTGQWFVEHPDFKRWQTSPESMILWLHGPSTYIRALQNTRG